MFASIDNTLALFDVKKEYVSSHKAQKLSHVLIEFC